MDWHFASLLSESRQVLRGTGAVVSQQDSSADIVEAKEGMLVLVLAVSGQL